MANASNSQWSINLNKQSSSEVETVATTRLTRFPIQYGGGFDVTPEVDSFGDLVDPIFESSRTQILGATTRGAIGTAPDSNLLAFLLGTMLGTVNTASLGGSPTVYEHTLTPSSTATPNFHTTLFNDGTCDRRVVGAVPVELGFGCDYNQKRMNAQVSFAGIRREDNATTKAFTSAQASDVNTTTEVITATGHTFANGDAVTVASSVTLPTGLVAATPYYIGLIGSNVFTLYDTYLNAITGGSTGKINITAVGSGTMTTTLIKIAHPTQSSIVPFFFTQAGASLSLNIDAAGAVDYTSSWAGFSYSLSNAISAEQRAGANTYSKIERVDRVQTLDIVLDYADSTFKDIITSYQKNTTPNQFQIILKLRGNLISGTNYHQLQGTFYNCNLAQHGYSQNPEIGKQTLSFTVNHDVTAGKSVEWKIQNANDGYIS